MSKTLQEVISEIKSGVSTSENGKQVRSFSKKGFYDVAKALLNTPEHTVEVASLKDGKLHLEPIQPVKAFRNNIRKVLVQFGVDKQEADRVLTESVTLDAEGMYELVSETLYQYLDAGKKFDFLPREDFIGSLTLEEVGESVTEHKSIQDPNKKFKVKKKAHKQLVKKSKCPSWLKEQL